MLPSPLTTWSSRAKLGLDSTQESTVQDVEQTIEVQLDVVILDRSLFEAVSHYVRLVLNCQKFIL